MSQDDTQEKKLTYEKTKNPKEIKIRDGRKNIFNCQLNIEVDRAILSFDESTLIVSENGYLKVSDLKKCDKVNPTVHRTPEDDGLLVDFNSKNNIYVSLVVVSTQPITYVAYVGKAGVRKNIVNLPGSYSNRKTMNEMQQGAFNYSDDFLSRPKISLDGRYVAPTGDIDCSAQSHPGVWDIEKNKKLAFLDGVESSAKCKSLFDK